MTSASTLSRLIVALTLLAGAGAFFCALAFTPPVRAASFSIVISQVYGGGGNADAPYNADFVELFNAGAATRSLNGWSVQYAAAGSIAWANGNKVDLPNIELAPGQYFLIQMSALGENGAALPVPDASGAVQISNTDGKIALVASTALLTGAGCPFSSEIIDFVAYGSDTNCSETAAAPAASNANAIARAQAGCIDSDNNRSDFSTAAPHPRNTNDFFAPCFPLTSTTTPTPTLIHTSTGTPTPTETPGTTENPPGPVSHLVISQVYPSGGAAGATYQHDFVEIFNPSASAVSLAEFSLQYAGAKSAAWAVNMLPGESLLQPGQHFLIRLASGGTDGASLPPPDLISSMALATTGGKIALVRGSESLNGVGCPFDPRVIDFFGFGTEANCFEGTAALAAPATPQALMRRANACQDTDDNAADFQAHDPAPRNSQFPLQPCQPTGLPDYTITPIPTSTATFTSSPPAPTGDQTFTSTPTATQEPAPSTTLAPPSTARMVFSELQMSGPDGPDDQFIEVYNSGDHALDLSSWKIFHSDDLGSPRLLYTFSEITVGPGQHFLLVRAGANIHPTTAADALFSFRISIRGGIALLNAEDVIVDQIGWSETSAYGEGSRLAPPDGAPEFRWERKPGGAAGNCADTDDNASDFSSNLNPGNPQNLAAPAVYCADVATATPSQTPTPTATATSTPSVTPFAPDIRINEFLPKPALDWNGDNAVNTQDEWIELYNPNPFAVDLGGWSLDDIESGGAAPYSLPDTARIPANGFLIIYGSASGVTLNDNGDQTVRLLFPDNTLADTTSYNGSSNDISYSRNPDGAGAFTTACLPTPLAPNCTITPTSTLPPTPTLTPTSTLTPTPTFTPTLRAEYGTRDVTINELAWAGTAADGADEWIELANQTDAPILLDGWQLRSDDNTPHILLIGSIPPRGFFLLERTNDETISDITADQSYTGALENTGEVLALHAPSGKEIDTANIDGSSWDAGSADSKCSMERIDSRAPDSPANWQTNDNLSRNGQDANNNPICGSPGRQNSAQTASVTPSPTLTPTQTASPTFTPVSGGLFVNEFMPNPALDWNNDGAADDGDEWIEIYNANPFRIDLSGWVLDDVADGGSAPYRIPEGTKIKRHGYLVLHRAETGLALNNSNDDVRLVRSDRVVADSIRYKTSDPDVAWSRNPDGGPVFTQYCAPTPRAANCLLAPTPTVTPTPYAQDIVINEFLPAPYLDWNGDSLLDSGDEWVEIFNASTHSIDLSGWQLDDNRSGSSAFRIPDGTLLPARGFLVFFASETTIGLNNDGDTVRLLHPDGTAADRKKYSPLQTNKSYARNPDGGSSWSIHCFPTPGLPNCSQQPAPTPTRVFNLTSIADARALPEGSRVSVLGSVVAKPCELDTYGHAMTLSDGVAGIQVYLAYPSQLSCSIPRGEQIVVTGILSDHYGLRALYPDSNLQLARHYAPPREIAPRQIHTGELGEADESMPLMIQGAVSNGRNGDVIWVNDGTGMVEVYADPASGATFAGITRGSLVRVYGVGYQNNQFKLPEEGYYLRPRAPDDVIVLELADKMPDAPAKRDKMDLGTVSIQQALAARLRTYVTIGGVVTAPPGIIAARNFWIQDDSGRGARIYVAEEVGEFLQPKLNERVSVRGRVVSAFGSREIRVELADDIHTHGIAQPVTPTVLDTGAVDFSNEGTLVAVQGFVAREDGREIYVDDGTGEVLVYLDATTRIRWRKPHVGDPARIVGVVTRFRGEPEILPRFQSDVQFGFLLLPVAGEQIVYMPRLQARGRIGEDLAMTRRVRAQAAVQLADNSGPRGRKPAASTQAPVTQNVLSDTLTLASFMLFGASAVCAALAARKYALGRRTKSR